jgi:hypothetical protein
VLLPNKLDSITKLRLSSVRLGGKLLIVVQRSLSDYSIAEAPEHVTLIFAIGTMDQRGFRVLHWKQNTEDEEEVVLGTIQLKSGLQFLITVVHDPESQSFRVYGVRGGRLSLVYSGGGSSC